MVPEVFLVCLGKLAQTGQTAPPLPLQRGDSNPGPSTSASTSSHRHFPNVGSHLQLLPEVGSWFEPVKLMVFLGSLSNPLWPSSLILVLAQYRLA